MTKILTSRVKSYLWRAAGMSAVAGGAYFLKIGDIWAIDWKTMANLIAIAAIGLLVGEVTKWLNTPVPAPAAVPAAKVAKKKKK